MEYGKLYQTLLLATLCVACLKAQCDLGSLTGKAVEEHELNKDVPESVEIKYNGKVVDCNSLLKKATVKSAPAVSYTLDSDEEDNYYFLLMIDPDATTPQNPIYAPYLHWAIQNIPGNQVSRGEVVSNYHPPSPPPYSDPHRYIILIYRQPGFITERSLNQAAKNNFNVKSFVQSQNLKEPVAGNYFKVSAQ
ncbi:hypothetical protein JTE90_008868 [Oedothorax gibbosus]|uniref:Phosphatidylethanolamine-binding protein n=1 Tax=Oedothorax gibbosus TaxID=931172 RepID=A0AAV6TU88_9ARAC|nr:hypothetical protein JTE90_008868 [Oedothorax gibbosus]